MLDAITQAGLDFLGLQTLAFLFFGVLVGLVFGVIPGLGGTTALAILLPLTFGMNVTDAFAMCGGINLSQSVGAKGETKNKLKNPLLYNLGRVISYTLIGGVVGGIGSVLFLSETVKAILLALAAVGMLLMGLSMLGWLPWWLTPRVPKFLSSRIGKKGAGKGPLLPMHVVQP